MKPIQNPSRYVLFASLALNLFFLGAIASHLWAKRTGRGEGHFGKDSAVERYLADHKAQLRQSRTEVRQARKRVREELGKSDFAPTRLSTALADLRNTTLHAQEQMHVALLETAGDLSVEQRVELARALDRGRPTRRRLPGAGPGEP